MILPDLLPMAHIADFLWYSFLPSLVPVSKRSSMPSNKSIKESWCEVEPTCHLCLEPCDQSFYGTPSSCPRSVFSMEKKSDLGKRNHLDAETPGFKS